MFHGGFGRVLKGFWEGLGKVWEGFERVLVGVGEDFRCVFGFRSNYGSKCFAEGFIFGDTCVEHPGLQNLL